MSFQYFQNRAFNPSASLSQRVYVKANIQNQIDGGEFTRIQIPNANNSNAIQYVSGSVYSENPIPLLIMNFMNSISGSKPPLVETTEEEYLAAYNSAITFFNSK
jgi:hypothetical protein